MSRTEDLDRAFSAVTNQRAQALILAAGNPVGFANRGQIASFAQNRLPSMYPQKDFVDAGGLMSYGPSNPDMRRRAAVYVEPHFHPDDRITTVISGTIHVGYGEQFDESKMKALPAGSVWTEPANQPHFAWAKDGEVVLQVVGNGPSGTTPVRPRQ